MGGGGFQGCIQAGIQAPGSEGSWALGIMSQSLPNCSWNSALRLAWVGRNHRNLSCRTGSEYPSLPACLDCHLASRLVIAVLFDTLFAVAASHRSLSTFAAPKSPTWMRIVRFLPSSHFGECMPAYLYSWN